VITPTAVAVALREVAVDGAQVSHRPGRDQVEQLTRQAAHVFIASFGSLIMPIAWQASR
jgi:hypothetical protein